MSSHSRCTPLALDDVSFAAPLNCRAKRGQSRQSNLVPRSDILVKKILCQYRAPARIRRENYSEILRSCTGVKESLLKIRAQRYGVNSGAVHCAQRSDTRHSQQTVKSAADQSQ